MKKEEINSWIEKSKDLNVSQRGFLNGFLQDSLTDLYKSLERCNVEAVGYPYIQMAIAIKLSKK